MSEELVTRELSFRNIKFPVLLSSDEVIISEELARSAVWEPSQLELYPKLVQKGDVFVDIGANVGINSLFMSHSVDGANIHAIEASPVNFRILQMNCGERNIALHHLAIADSNGVLGFSGHGTNAQIASRSHPATSQVRCQTLEAFVQEHRLDDIALVKIDVEGFTDVVLAGATTVWPRVSHAIVEFSVEQVLDRYETSDQAIVAERFQEQLDQLGEHFRYFYYISRSDGLISFSDASHLLALLPLEHNVGDVLFSKEKHPASDANSFALKRVGELMRQNHFRILEVAALTQETAQLKETVEELKKENHYRIQEIQRLKHSLDEISEQYDEN